MATDAVGEEFITIVPVGESRPPMRDNKSTFVTVLTVGTSAGAAVVTVIRPKGARLGLGLKFEGGSAAAENVRRLLVQSCAENSPAANATTPWGKLIPGDEILAIDGVSVSELTRIDCVRRLKDSDEALKLLVRHFDSDGNVVCTSVESSDCVISSKQVTELVRPSLPPPVPPRKLGKKNSFKDKQILEAVGEENGVANIQGLKQIMTQKEGALNGQNTGFSTIKLSRKSSFDSHIHRQNKESITCLKKGSPEGVRRLVRRLSDGKNMPPEAEIYIDLLSTEWERCLLIGDTESDDTGSSISTIVDRLGSMGNSLENSIPSTPIMQTKTIDIKKVLNCIENIDSNILSNTLIANQKHIESGVTKPENPINGLSNDDTTKNRSIFAELKIKQENDSNNNSMVANGDNDPASKTVDVTENPKPIVEKPKPMPRNTKIERSASAKKARPIPVPKAPAPAPPEPLLTPTKKNCIETWLKRSEAEMNNKTLEKIEDATPEALPRLIDFVPKPQFKEHANESPSIVRPSAPPPPPPVEVREDGSGASLDTIGELDETTDVTDNAKSVAVENETIERKPSFDRSCWEERANKSDNEDKSLSNDESSLPTCPRQPPDGVETPSEAVEKIPELPTRLPPRLPIGWPTSRTRFSYKSRTQDARSEASVRDKIAMFSTDNIASTDHVDKCGTLPAKISLTFRKSTVPYTNSYSDISSMDRRLTKSQDNLDELPRDYKRPEVLGALENTLSTTKSNKSLKVENKPLFYGSTTTLPTGIETTFTQTVYHSRSVSDDNSNKNIATHKSNLDYLIEQRKKSMSKLRGLVIPETQGPIIDLPEIKIQDPFSKSYLVNSQKSNINRKDSKLINTKSINLCENKWSTHFTTNNIPKYSPAFKRKSLQVYTPSSLSKESTPERKFSDMSDIYSTMHDYKRESKPLRNLIENKNRIDKVPESPLASKFTVNDNSKLFNKDFKQILQDVRDLKNVEIKICTVTEIADSDNDSAMSSTQSSYRSSASSPMHTLDTMESDSSHISPRISHYTSYSLVKTDIPSKTSIMGKNCEAYIKRSICRSVSSDTNASLSSSAGSAATSGSQASCSSLESTVTDSDKRKVSKSYNIDTINRRNILASAKCRSGKDTKLNSPVIETKFSHELNDRSPSPTSKTSNRLSTLTTSVSAISNKGENRRRNKIIHSDSDSDSEVNVRQRKTEFKNTRLKRNSSSANKNKQNEINFESTKVDDAPKIISEKIIKEINKAGLENFQIKTSHEKSTKIIDTKKVESKMTIKQDKFNKTEILPILVNLRDVKVRGKSKPDLGLIKNDVKYINEADSNKSTEELKTPTHVVKLRKEPGSGIGLILAGGTDCEAKDVTIHRVLADSIAAKAGLKRGSKVQSINGCSMKGLTHAQSVSVLKEQRSEIAIEIENEFKKVDEDKTCRTEKADSPKEDIRVISDKDKSSSSFVTVTVEKAGGGAGLGFGLDGGRDSPLGDLPLTVKKIFAGGAAAQCGRIVVGAELISAGGQAMEGFTRTQAWAALKALPSGPVTLVLKNP